MSCSFLSIEATWRKHVSNVHNGSGPKPSELPKYGAFWGSILNKTVSLFVPYVFCLYPVSIYLGSWMSKLGLMSHPSWLHFNRQVRKPRWTHPLLAILVNKMVFWADNSKELRPEIIYESLFMRVHICLHIYFQHIFRDSREQSWYLYEVKESLKLTSLPPHSPTKTFCRLSVVPVSSKTWLVVE